MLENGNVIMDVISKYLKQVDREKREWMLGAGFSLLIHLLPFLVLFCFFAPHYGGGGLSGVTVVDLSQLLLTSKRPGAAERVAKPLKTPVQDVREKTQRAVSFPSVPLIPDSIPVKEKIDKAKDDSFVVMSNGELRGLRIDRRSGDDTMDNLAVSVIQTSSPVWPHPAGVNLPFIGMTVLFSPEGIY